MSRKGQLTLFMIVGIMLVFSVSLLFIFRDIGQDSGQFKPLTEEVPRQVQPIKQFIEGCIRRTTEQGLRLLGNQGGYINTTRFGLIDTGFPTSSNAVKFPETEITIPYWWYMKSSNRCTTCEFSDENIPKINKNNGPRSMEAQLDLYIKDHLQECTGLFQNFPGTTVTFGEIVPDSNIATSDVFVNIEWPITVNFGTTEMKMSKFYIKIPLKLRTMINTGLRMIEEEAETRYLEYAALEFISIFSGKDRSKLPPISDTDFKMRPIYWVPFEVEKNLREVLQIHIPSLKAAGSLNEEIPLIPDDLPYASVIKAIYNQFLLNLGYTGDYNVNFYYFEDWPLYFDAGGGIIMPEVAMPTIIPFFPMTVVRYNTVYDLSFPTIVEINDPGAFGGRGYTLRFAMEGNVRDNEALDTSYATSYVEGEEGSMLCDLNKRNSGMVKFKVLDYVTGDPIEGVDVSFTAGETCIIGSTDENGEFKDKFPIALGEIVLMHGDYLSHRKYIEMILDLDRNLGTIKLKPIMTKTAVGRKKTLKRFNIKDWRLVLGDDPLEENEQLMVILERIKDDPGEGEFFQAVSLSGDEPTSEFDVVPGTYEVTLVFTHEDNVTIPPYKKCIKYSSGLKEKKKCWDMPAAPGLDMPVPPTTVEFDWTAPGSINRMKYQDKVTFYGLFADFPSAEASLRIEDLEIIDNLGNRYLSELEPKFIK